MTVTRAAAAATCLAVAAAATGVTAGPAAAGMLHEQSLTQRTVVAVIGDSLVEDAYLPDPATQALGPRLRVLVRARGLDAGGPGFIPAHPATLVPAVAPSPGWPVNYTGAWTARTHARDPMGAAMLSTTSDPMASASPPVSRAAVAALFAATAPATRLTLRAGNRRRDVRSHRVGTLELAWFPRLSRLRPRLELRTGALALLGFFARRPVVSRRQLEISIVGRGGAAAADGIGTLERAALERLAPDLTVIALGTNDELGALVGRDPGSHDAMAGIGRLGAIARRSGRCLVLLPPDGPATAAVAGAFARRLRAEAARARCRTSAAWRSVLADPGLRLPDELHPTPAGVRAMAAALLPVIIGRR